MSAAEKTFVAEQAARPFVKWAGGKTQLLLELDKHVPRGFGRYFEPFVGGGAFYFWLQNARRITQAVLGDANERLVNAYRSVRDDVGGVVACLGQFEERHSEKHFYAMRKEIDQGRSFVRAARFIYLNKTCFNGLWRVNRKGEYNVPFDKSSMGRTILDEANLRLASKCLRSAELTWVDFEMAVDGEMVKHHARRGDFVYFDPPYWPRSGTADFTNYTKAPFGSAEQERLRNLALRLKKRGVHVLLSNADVPEVRKLYKQGFEKRVVQARRNINSNASRRGSVGELLIW